MIDVAIAIDAEAVNVIRSRTGAGAYDVDGNWNSAAPSDVTIRATIQPATGNKLLDVPEGMRTASDPTGSQINAGWLLWSRSEVALNDEITHQSIRYRVMYVWPRVEGGFYRAAMGRLTL
jgi:hypothetical protein